jgi:hypothetical protein
VSATDEWYEEVRRARADMAARWLPDGAHRAVAAAMLAAAPDAAMVIVPLIQPGKARGVWTDGQPVITVRGALFLVGDGFADYATARATAVHLGELALAEHAAAGQPPELAGTVAWATVDRDGHAAVFEW